MFMIFGIRVFFNKTSLRVTFMIFGIASFVDERNEATWQKNTINSGFLRFCLNFNMMVLDCYGIDATFVTEDFCLT